MPFSGIAGAIVGGAGQLLGGMLDAHYDRDLARMNQSWQREVYQNQLQWRAADAKKAGLHPLAAIGNIASPSNITSGPSSYFSPGLGKLGEGIGDAFAAYKSKDEMAAEKAIAELREDANFRAQQRESEARSRLLDAQAKVAESQARSQSYVRPMATGREVIQGQVEADSKPKPKFTRFLNDDGSLSGRKPTEDYQGVHDDKILLEYAPFAEAYYVDTKEDLVNLLNALPQSQLDDLLAQFSQISTRPW